MQYNDAEYYKEGLSLAKDELYSESIIKLKLLIDEFPNSDLVKDALFNIGLCYFKMQKYEVAIDTFYDVIIKYPNSSITEIENSNEEGKIAAKCHYYNLFSYLGLNLENKAIEELTQLRAYNHNSFVILNDNKLTYEDLAKKIFK